MNKVGGTRGLVPALRWFVDRYARRLSNQVEFEAIGFRERPTADVETALYGIVQEALTNVARHAQASTARIRLEHREPTVVGSIEDDGQGFDVQELARRAVSEVGTGLIGMRERLRALGGHFTIETAPGQGVRLSLETRVPPQDDSQSAQR